MAEPKKQSEILGERIAAVESSTATALAERDATITALATANVESEKRIKALEDKLATRLRGPEAGGTERPKPISIARMCLGVAAERMGQSDPWQHSGYEREILAECKTRSTLISGQDSLGGYMVQEQFLPQEFIDLLRSKLVLTQLGIRTVPGLVGAPVRLNKQTGSATAYYVGETSAPTASNPTFGMHSMYPKGLKGLVVMSKLQAMLATPAFESYVMNELTKAMAERRELAILQGVGSENEPLGLVNTANVGSSSISAIPTDLDDYQAMVYTVEAANADSGRLGWLMNPREWNTLRTLKTGTGNYLLPRAADGSTPKMLHGYPVVTTTAVPITLGDSGAAGRVIFGDWSQIVDGEWQGITFDVSDKNSTYWAEGLLGVLVQLYHDVMVRQPTAFVVDDTVLAA